MKATAQATTRARGAHESAGQSVSTAVSGTVKSPLANSTEGKETTRFIARTIVVAMALRPGIASIGPALPFISRVFALSHTMASMLATVPILMMGLLALPSAWLGTRFGRSEVLLVSLRMSKDRSIDTTIVPAIKY
jgi:CP family cyanate transporter-like MFS transporter